jgi:hypothetical protein
MCIRDRLDAAVFALATSLTSGATDTGNDIVLSDVTAAINTLAQLNAPRPWIGFLHYEQLYQLASEASTPFMNIAASGQRAEDLWNNWDIQRALGVTWIISNSVYDDGTDCWGMILSQQAIGLTMKLLPTVTTEYDQSRRATEISSVSQWGVGVINSSMGVYLRFDAP